MLFLFFVFYTYLTNGLGKRFTDSENFVKKISVGSIFFCQPKRISFLTVYKSEWWRFLTRVSHYVNFFCIILHSA